MYGVYLYQRANYIMKSSDVIKALEKRGWYLVSIRGSHHHFRHDAIVGLVTVPHPKHNIPKGTLKSILKQAQLHASDFIKH